MIDLGDVIDEEAQDVTIERKSGGSYNADGEWAGETSEATPERAVVQPAVGRGLLDLAEGERLETEYFLWTRSAIAEDDTVLYGGSRYRIVKVWRRPEGGYTKAALGLHK